MVYRLKHVIVAFGVGVMLTTALFYWACGRDVERSFQKGKKAGLEERQSLPSYEDFVVDCKVGVMLGTYGDSDNVAKFCAALHDHEGHRGYQPKPGSKVWNRKMSWCEKNFDCDSESAVARLRGELKKCEDGHLDGRIEALINPAFGGVGVRSIMRPPGMWNDPAILTHGDPVLPVQLEQRIEEATLAHMGFEPLVYEGDDTVIGQLGVEPFESLYICDSNATCYLMTDDGSVVYDIIIPLTMFPLDPMDSGSSF
jgi:hypothetical protein